MDKYNVMDRKHEKRFTGLNIAKGFGIILVVLGHALSALPMGSNDLCELLRTLIYLIHMPLFFVISGFLFENNTKKYQNRGLKVYVASKFRVFIIPYISFTILIILIVSIGLYIEPLQIVIRKLRSTNISIIKSIVLYENPIDDHLWFSYVMFLVLILSYLMIKIDKRLIVMIFYVLYLETFFITLPELIWKVFRYMLLFQIGRNLFQYNEYFNKAKKFGLFIVFFLSTGVYLILKEKNLGIMGAIKPIAEISSSILILRLSFELEHTKCKQFLDYLGEKSYAIYLIHQPYIVPVIMAVVSGGTFLTVFAVILSLVLGLFIPIIIQDKIISKSKILSFLLLGGHK